ncbi:unnamed protein product [Larinioides sclopetarius]|uniref:G-protein coupled receptors family 1 profile domain-containing protein n=1 Tax=Larinioides sclopetarius TaxID=280406 RepID=A0AAV2B2M9_9ARAC
MQDVINLFIGCGYSMYIHHNWVLGDTLCRLFPFFFYGNVAASLMSMTAITINRYILINHYKYYDKIYQRKYIALMIAFCWIFSFSMLAPTLAGAWGEFGYHGPSFSCTILRRAGRSPKKFLFVLGFLLPCLIIVVSYSCIFYRSPLCDSFPSIIKPDTPNASVRLRTRHRRFESLSSTPHLFKSRKIEVQKAMHAVGCTLKPSSIF